MLTITVTTLNDKPVAAPLRAAFGEGGGTIGRGIGSTLLLPDPERKISRTHAVLTCTRGTCTLRDHGSVVPVIVNGQALGNGRDAVLRIGDEIRIAGYVMRVDPADRAPVDENETTQAFEAIPIAEVLAHGSDGVAGAPMPDMRAASVAAQQGASGPAASAPVACVEGQVDNSAAPPAERAQEAVLSWEAGAGHDAKPGDIKTVIVPSPDATDGSVIMSAASSGLANAPDTEPMSSTSALNASASGTSTAGTSASNTSAASTSASSTIEPGAAALNTTASNTTSSMAAVTAAISAEAAATSVPVSPTAGVAADRHPSAALADTPTQAGASVEALLQAFLTGARVPNLALPGGLTPERMREIGTLLRLNVQGLLDLLNARAVAKREVRADATIIVANDNNPLKFSPSVEAALTHLIAPRGHGFMPPLRAVADAHDNLRSHQLGFMAGMQAALAAVLARFDPAGLERRFGERSMAGALLPMTHKARLWEGFVELYASIAEEAQADFHTLFGQEFLRAYHAEVAQWRARTQATPG